MFTKTKKIGGGQYSVYQKTTDWDGVFAALIWILIALFLLSMCSGG